MRRERGFPLVDERGRLQIETIRDLSQEKLGQWLRAVLNGNDPGASSGDRAELPHGFLTKVYRQLDPMTREAFQDAAISLLWDLVHGQAWPADAADELLLLAASIFPDSQRRNQVLDLLRRIANNPALRRRAFSTLLALRYIAKPDFWIEAYRLGGKSYAPVVLHGLALFNLQEAFRWAEQEANDEEVLPALARLLPNLVEQHGGERLSSLVRDFIKRAPEPGREDLLRIADRAGLRISHSPLGTEEWLEVIEGALRGKLPLERWDGSVGKWVLSLLGSSRTSDNVLTIALNTVFDRWDELVAGDEATCRRMLELAASFPSRAAFLAVSDSLEAQPSQPSDLALRDTAWETLVAIVTNLPYLRNKPAPPSGRSEVLWKRFIHLFPVGLNASTINKPAFRMLLRRVDHDRLVDIFILTCSSVGSVFVKDALPDTIGGEKFYKLLSDAFALDHQERFPPHILNRFLGDPLLLSEAVIQDRAAMQKFLIAKDELPGGPDNSMMQLLNDFQELDAA